MPESTLLLSSVVPACDSCRPCSQEVEESMSPAVGDPKPTATAVLGPLAGSRRTAPPDLGLLNFSTAKSREQSQEVAEFGSADRRLGGLRLFDGLRRAADCKNGNPRYQNRRNKARMFMKTKEEVKKSTGRDGKKALTRLVTLATLPPRERALTRFGRGSVFMGEIQKSWERTRGSYWKQRIAAISRRKNELKTNSFLSTKCANRAPIQKLPA